MKRRKGKGVEEGGLRKIEERKREGKGGGIDKGRGGRVKCCYRADFKIK
jgi:hypothetical protein